MYSPTSLNQYKVTRLIDSKNNEVQTNKKPDPDYVCDESDDELEEYYKPRLNRITAMDLKSSSTVAKRNIVSCQRLGVSTFLSYDSRESQ